MTTSRKKSAGPLESGEHHSRRISHGWKSSPSLDSVDSGRSTYGRKAGSGVELDSPGRDSISIPLPPEEVFEYDVKAFIVDCDVDSILSVTKSVKFEIDVTLSTPDGFEARWSVFRTETEFKLLYQRLKSSKNFIVPKIPSGKLTQRLSMSASERKTKNYQQFLESLFDIPELIKSDVMCSFLIGGFADIIRSMKSGDSGTPMGLTMNFRQTKKPTELKSEAKLADELSPPGLGFDLGSLDLKAQLAAAERKVEELQKALKRKELDVSEMEDGHRALLARIIKLKEEKKQLKAEVGELQEFVKAKLGAISPVLAAAVADGVAIGGTTSFSYESHRAADLASMTGDTEVGTPSPPRTLVAYDDSDSD